MVTEEIGLLQVNNASAEPKSLTRFETAVGYILFVLFGLFPFLLINALFSQLSIFVVYLPEKDKISSIIGSTFQISNVVPVAYMILSSLDMSAFRRLTRFTSRFSSGGGVTLIVLLQILGILNAFFYAFFWRLQVDGYSVGIITGTIISGIVGCTGVTVIFRFVSKYKPVFVAAASTGTAMSGGVCAVLAVIQSSFPQFDVFLYFMSCAVVMILSLFATFCIAYTDLGRRFEHAKHVNSEEEPISSSIIVDSIENKSMNKPQFIRILKSCATAFTNQFIVGFVHFYTVPGILPFGFRNAPSAEEQLRWSTNVGLVSSILGRVVTSFHWLRNYNSWVHTLIHLSFGVYLTVGALLNDNPFFAHNAWTLILANTMLNILFGYANTMCYMLLNRDVDPSFAARANGWGAVAFQMGAFAGSFAALGFTSLPIFPSRDIVV